MGLSTFNFFDFSGSVVVLKLVASVMVVCTLLLETACCTTELTATTTEPLASELTDWFEFSFPITVGVRAPVFLFLLWLDALLDADEFDFVCPLFLWPALAPDPDLIVATAAVEVLPSCPNTLSDWVTIVSTKLEVVNLLGLVVFSLGVLRPLPLLSSATPFSSRLGLVLDLFLELVVDLELELFRLPLDEDFIGVSASFSGDESDEPLSAGIGL